MFEFLKTEITHEGQLIKVGDVWERDGICVKVLVLTEKKIHAIKAARQEPCYNQFCLFMAENGRGEV